MQLTFDESSSTVWLFATSDELLKLADALKQRTSEAKLGESLTIFEASINKSPLSFRISSAQPILPSTPPGT